MTHKLSKEDIHFLSLFDECKIEPVSFHHREHIRLAYSLLVKNDVSDALMKLKTSLLRFIAFNGVDTSRYHETMTLAWLLAVKHFMHMSKSASCFEAFINDNMLLLDKTILYSHYREETLNSDKARKEFIAPDLEPIPYYKKVYNI